jgi:hypothetical protein
VENTDFDSVVTAVLADTVGDEQETRGRRRPLPCRATRRGIWRKTVISKEQIIPQLLEECPGFRVTWNEHVTYWNGEQAGIYNDLSESLRYPLASAGRAAPPGEAFI